MQLAGRSCSLRPLRADDAGSLVQHANDRRIWLNLRDRFPHPYSREDAERYIDAVATQQPVTSFAIAVNDAAVGGVAFTVGTDIERVNAEIGYWLGAAFWGRGIMTEAVAIATTYAFDALAVHRVFAVPFTHNVASQRVLEKNGYVREGLMRRSALKDGELLDQYLYGAYDDTWRSAHR